MFQAIIRSTTNVTRRMLTALQPRGLSGAQDITEGEGRIKSVLQEKFPTATDIQVEDISGGCGAMYQVHVESDVFKGKRTVKQHMMVNKLLNTVLELYRVGQLGFIGRKKSKGRLRKGFFDDIIAESGVVGYRYVKQMAQNRSSWKDFSSRSIFGH